MPTCFFFFMANGFANNWLLDSEEMGSESLVNVLLVFFPEKNYRLLLVSAGVVWVEGLAGCNCWRLKSSSKAPPGAQGLRNF